MNKALLSSERMDWATPTKFFRWIEREFAFDLDVCATPETAKCERYFTPETDGLSQAWGGICWMNPPYGSTIGRWVEKAWRESRDGATVVCLLPARTDTSWWHRYCMKGEIRFIRGRLNFDDGKNPAPFPSALVIFRPPTYRRPMTFGLEATA